MSIFLEVCPTGFVGKFLVNVDQIQIIKQATLTTSKVKVAGITEFTVVGTPDEIMGKNGFYQRDPNE